MEKEIQDKAREKVIERLNERAWECLMRYQYWGAKYEVIEKQAVEYEDRINKFEEMIKNIRLLPDGHSKESRTKIGMCQKDIADYTKRIQGMHSLIKKLQDNAVKWQQEGVEALELVDQARVFSVRTPAEIEAAKKVDAPAEPVVAGGETKS